MLLVDQQQVWIVEERILYTQLRIEPARIIRSWCACGGHTEVAEDLVAVYLHTIWLCPLTPPILEMN